MLFAPGMIPDDINTFEKLAAWASGLLNYHGFTQEYNERPPSAALGDSGIQATFERNGPFRSFQNDPRLIYRHSFRLADDYGSSAYTMEYQAVQETITSPPNVDYLNPNYQAPAN